MRIVVGSINESVPGEVQIMMDNGDVYALREERVTASRCDLRVQSIGHRMSIEPNTESTLSLGRAQ